MVDIHSHILPGLDDGSQDMDKSIAMAEVAVDSGVTAMIATPHCNQRGVFENYASNELVQCLEELKSELLDADINLALCLGAEVFATPDTVKMYKEKKLLTLNYSRYLLLEFDFMAELQFMQSTLYGLLDEDVVPILAHPERYAALQNTPEAAMLWNDEGVGIQLNKGSLFGRFGRRALQLSHTLLGSGHVSCIASDAHGSERRTPDMSMVDAMLRTEYSDNTAELLLRENPERIMTNQPLISMENLLRY